MRERDVHRRVDQVVVLAAAMMVAGIGTAVCVAWADPDDTGGARRAALNAVLTVCLLLAAFGCALITVRTGGGAIVPGVSGGEAEPPHGSLGVASDAR